MPMTPRRQAKITEQYTKEIGQATHHFVRHYKALVKAQQSADYNCYRYHFVLMATADTRSDYSIRLFEGDSLNGEEKTHETRLSHNPVSFINNVGIHQRRKTLQQPEVLAQNIQLQK